MLYSSMALYVAKHMD